MIAIGSDHAGYGLKQTVIQHLEDLGIAFNDYGTYSSMSCDYPDFAEAVCQAVMKGQADKGILICGTGLGMSMAANKVPGIRAAVCGDCFSAKMAREHNDANILCMGARVTGPGLALIIADNFLSAKHSEDERHHRRVAKIEQI